MMHHGGFLEPILRTINNVDSSVMTYALGTAQTEKYRPEIFLKEKKTFSAFSILQSTPITDDAWKHNCSCECS